MLTLDIELWLCDFKNQIFSESNKFEKITL